MKPRRKLILLGIVALLTLLIAWTIGNESPDLEAELARAAKEGDVARLDSLVGRGADLNSLATPWQDTVPWTERLSQVLFSRKHPSGEGRTPLMWAISSMRIETVRWLLEKGANPNRVSDDGYSAIEFAIGTPMLAILLKHGCNPDNRRSKGRTALMLAASSGSLTSVEALIRAGANVNCQDELGLTPLRYALYSADKRIILRLIQAGADPSIRDTRGHDAYWFAQRHSITFPASH